MDLSPWGFVKTLVPMALEKYIKALDLPSWYPRETLFSDLDFALHRGVTTWNVEEVFVIDKEGGQVDREFRSADFEVSIRWKGRVHSDLTLYIKWVNGEFESFSFWELELVKDLIEVSEIPDGAGFREELDLD